jgi:anti-sigma factor RsiW
MVMTCEQVWQQVSAYLDGELDPVTRAALEEHVKGCKRCTAVVDGTRNVVRVMADDRVLEVPAGYSRRLHQRMAEVIPRPRGTVYPWLMALAAAVLIAGTVVLANAAGGSGVERALHAQAGEGVPPDMEVVVSADGKAFHLAACTFIHEKSKLRTLTAQEAIKEGYVPCVRCMRKYLERASAMDGSPPWVLASAARHDD